MMKHLIIQVSVGEEARLELCGCSSGEVRYTLYVVDAPKSTKASLPMGVFIVPQRR